MEYYDWQTSVSKKNVEAIFGKPSAEIENIEVYSKAVDCLMNEGKHSFIDFI